jgi:hypothetical protein
MRLARIALALLALTAPAFAQAYDPKPWLADLDEMHAAFSDKYASFEWSVFQHEVDMSALFADARRRVEDAGNDGDARAAFDRLIRKLGDGHVELHWPGHPAGAPQAVAAQPCSDYDAIRSAKPLVALAKGYEPLETPQSPLFPAGTILVGAHRVGVIKIGLFSPTGSPALCRQALAAHVAADAIDDWTAARFNEAFTAQLEALKRANIDTLLVDIAGNGGGSEWADAAARMLTPIRLKSPRMDFVRGPHWVKKFADQDAALRKAARGAPPKDRAMLLRYADQAAAKTRIAATPCDASPYWQGKHPACAWLGAGFYQTGILDSADPQTLRGKPWADLVFTPMEFRYREGVWRGALIVLVDSGSASSSERFSGELQANHAALIMGEPTSGAVGGHTDGGTPTTLSHSGAVLALPDCGGDGDQGSIVPDVLVGFRPSDGPHARAAAFLAKLPEAVQRASGPP